MPYSTRPRMRMRARLSAAVSTALLPRLRNAARDPLATRARESFGEAEGTPSSVPRAPGAISTSPGIAQQLRVQRSHAACDGSPVELGATPLQRRGGAARGSPWVVERPSDRVCHGFSVATRHQQSVDLVMDELRYASDLRCNDRGPALHVLENGKRQILVMRRENGDVRGRDEIGDIATVAQELHTLAQPQRGAQGFEHVSGPNRRFGWSGARDPELNFGPAPSEPLERPNDDFVRFLGSEHRGHDRHGLFVSDAELASYRAPVP